MEKPRKLTFMEEVDVETQVFEWGRLTWLSEPRVTKAEKFSAGIVALDQSKGHTSTIWRLSFSSGSVHNEQPIGELQLSGCFFLGRDGDYVGRVQIQMLDIMDSVDELSSIEDFRGVRK